MPGAERGAGVAEPTGAVEDGALLGVGDTGSGALAVGRTGAVLGCGEGRAGDDVQPATSASAGRASAADLTVRAIGEWA